MVLLLLTVRELGLNGFPQVLRLLVAVFGFLSSQETGGWGVVRLQTGCGGRSLGGRWIWFKRIYVLSIDKRKERVVVKGTGFRVSIFWSPTLSYATYVTLSKWLNQPLLEVGPNCVHLTRCQCALPGLNEHMGGLQEAPRSCHSPALNSSQHKAWDAGDTPSWFSRRRGLSSLAFKTDFSDCRSLRCPAQACLSLSPLFTSLSLAFP